MEREEVERLKKKMRPTLERGRRAFGKEYYDQHIKDILTYFDMDINNKDVKEIFDIT